MKAAQNKKEINKLFLLTNLFGMTGTRGRIRTYDSRIRNPVLYPLSYAGIFEVQEYTRVG